MYPLTAWQRCALWGYVLAVPTAWYLSPQIATIVAFAGGVPLLWLATRTGYFRRAWACYTQTRWHMALAAAVFILACFLALR